jgi:hypothetical protein
MTDQHRATPEQWKNMEEHKDDSLDDGYASCILEFRDRIAALEADQLEQAESHRFCVDAIVRRMEGLELAHRVLTGTLSPLEREQLGVVPAAEYKAAMDRAACDARDAASAEARPAGGLVERVALTRMNPPLDEDDLKYARAAIREVAAFLEATQGDWCASAAEVVAELVAELRQEADR